MNALSAIDNATITVLTAFGGGMAGGAWWLSWQFSKVRDLIHSEMKRHDEKDTKQFSSIRMQIQRLELREFGFTPAGIASDTNAD